MSFYNELDLEIKHAERVINASTWDKEKCNWWKAYRHKLLKLLLKIQIKTFDRS
jgi:hypothetical protein